MCLLHKSAAEKADIAGLKQCLIAAARGAVDSANGRRASRGGFRSTRSRSAELALESLGNASRRLGREPSFSVSGRRRPPAISRSTSGISGGKSLEHAQRSSRPG